MNHYILMTAKFGFFYKKSKNKGARAPGAPTRISKTPGGMWSFLPQGGFYVREGLGAGAGRGLLDMRYPQGLNFIIS